LYVVGRIRPMGSPRPAAPTPVLRAPKSTGRDVVDRLPETRRVFRLEDVAGSRLRVARLV
jgi:hypothetical protein